jgi:modulator of FtsH protease HflC
MKKYVLLPLLVIAIIIAMRLSFYSVDAAEYVYVTVLGQPVATYDGAAAENGAGLKVGWPWPIQQAQRLDRRLQIFDLPEVELLTNDPVAKTIDKMLLLKAYVCWRISDAGAVDLFVKRIGSADAARSILEKRVNSQLGAAIGQMRMDDLVNIADDPKTGKKLVDVTAEHLRQQLLETLCEPMRKEYGIDLVDVRLSRFNHPVNVRASIFERIKSERSKKVAEYQSDGETLSKNILSKADQEVREKLAQARSEEEKIKADADTEAIQVRNQAYRQDKEFYQFLKTMEKLQSILGGENTRLMISTDRPLFKLLNHPPRMKTEDKK